VPEHISILIHERPDLFSALITQIYPLADNNHHEDVDLKLQVLEIFTNLTLSTKSLHFGDFSAIEANIRKQKLTLPSDMFGSGSGGGDGGGGVMGGGENSQRRSKARSGILRERDDEDGDGGEDDEINVLLEAHEVVHEHKILSAVNHARSQYWKCAVTMFHKHRKEYLRGE
jgi:hypothetical protein